MSIFPIIKALLLAAAFSAGDPTLGASAGTDTTILDRNAVKRLVVAEAEGTTVPPSLALALAKVESDFQPMALSDRGARGVMQIMPATARMKFGVSAEELWRPRLNIQLGLNYLEDLIALYEGRWRLALSHYNGGVLRQSPSGPKAHGFNRRYVQSVLNWQRRYADQAQVWQRTPVPPEDGWTPARTRVVLDTKLPNVANELENELAAERRFQRRLRMIRADRAAYHAQQRAARAARAQRARQQRYFYRRH